MPLDTKTWQGRVFDSFDVMVTEEMIRAFAEALGETYTDTAPHSFPIRLYMDGPHGQEQLKSLGVPLKNVLHAGQGFSHFAPIRAGMVVTCSTRTESVSQSKSGAMIFVTFKMEFHEAETLLAQMSFSLAVRNTK